MKTDYIGKKVIVRGDRSGLTFGTLAARDGQEVRIKDCRRLWYWSGAASVFQLAKNGVIDAPNCKFTVVLDEIEIVDAVEVLPCTEEAIKSIESVNIWKR